MASKVTEPKRSNSMRYVFTTKLLLLLLSKPCNGVNGRLPAFTPTRPSTQKWKTRSSPSPLEVGLSVDESYPPTLYDILGISSSCSQSEIKARYRSLMREIHPDANRGKSNNTISTEEFTRVTEAYSTLYDPKLRLRYDRSLTAQKISGALENFLDMGINTAIPIIKQTAGGVEEVGEKVLRVGQKVGRVGEILMDTGDFVRGRLEVESKVKEMEQKASKEESRASAIRTDIAQLSAKRLPILQTSSETLTSYASTTIFDSFLSTDRRFDTISSSLSSQPTVLDKEDGDAPRMRATDQIIAHDIRVLMEMESRYANRISEYQRKEKEVRAAEQAARTAHDVETRTRRKLEEVQRELASALEFAKEKKKRLMEAKGEERSVEDELEKTKGVLKRQAEKVRSKLKQREDATMEREKLWMENEIFRLENEATVIREEADAMEKKLEEVRIENDKDAENSQLRP